jgi:hypothetical protein
MTFEKEKSLGTKAILLFLFSCKFSDYGRPLSLQATFWRLAKKRISKPKTVGRH